MTSALSIYNQLRDDFRLKDAKGSITFKLRDFSINVRQNNVVGNILEEWLADWMTSRSIPHIHNHKQASPDFWLNPEDTESDWLEIKSFTGSPNFDLAAFRSFINLIISEPWKLQSNYLLIKYRMEDGIVTIDDFWLKKVWEISCSSSTWPIRVQCKRNVISNIRPATWYSEDPDFPVFKSLEHFLSALEQTVYKYHDTNYLADSWEDRVVESYRKHYGVTLDIPRWNDIKDSYVPVKD